MKNKILICFKSSKKTCDIRRFEIFSLVVESRVPNMNADIDAMYIGDTFNQRPHSSYNVSDSYRLYGYELHQRLFRNYAQHSESSFSLLLFLKGYYGQVLRILPPIKKCIIVFKKLLQLYCSFKLKMSIFMVQTKRGAYSLVDRVTLFRVGQKRYSVIYTQVDLYKHLKYFTNPYIVVFDIEFYCNFMNEDQTCALIKQAEQLKRFLDNASNVILVASTLVDKIITRFDIKRDKVIIVNHVVNEYKERSVSERAALTCIHSTFSATKIEPLTTSSFNDRYRIYLEHFLFDDVVYICAPQTCAMSSIIGALFMYATQKLIRRHRVSVKFITFASITSKTEELLSNNGMWLDMLVLDNIDNDTKRAFSRRAKLLIFASNLEYEIGKVFCSNTNSQASLIVSDVMDNPHELTYHNINDDSPLVEKLCSAILRLIQ